jgi:hypothetical protein
MSDTLASLSAGNRSLILKLSTPTDWNNTKPRNDLSAIKIWYSTTAGFTPADINLAFGGPVSSSITIGSLAANTTYYVRYAFISSIDPTVYTYSKQYSQTTLSDAASIVASLSQDSVLLAANSSGTVTSYTNATTTMTITSNGIDDSVNWTYSVIKNSVTCSEATTSRTQTITSINSEVDVGYVDITASRTGYSSITKRFTVIKVKAGGQGVTIDISGITTFYKNSAATISPATTTLAAVAQNVTSPSYSWTISGATPTTSTSSSVVITPTGSSTISVSLIVTGSNISSTTVSKTMAVVDQGVPGQVGQAGLMSAFPSMYIWLPTGTSPSRPANDSTYTWATGSYQGAIISSDSTQGYWWSEPTSMTTPGYTLWQITIPLTVTGTTTTSALPWNTGNSPMRAISITGTNGSKGDTGNTGASGSGTYVITRPNDSNSSSDIDANPTIGEISLVVGRNAPILGDIVTITNGNNSRVVRWTGSTWAQQTTYITGSLIVENSISGSKIIAGTLTADKITAGTINSADANFTNVIGKASYWDADAGYVSAGILINRTNNNTTVNVSSLNSSDAGYFYEITSLGNTSNWQSVGSTSTAILWQYFKATGVPGNGTGTVRRVPGSALMINDTTNFTNQGLKNFFPSLYVDAAYGSAAKFFTRGTSNNSSISTVNIQGSGGYGLNIFGLYGLGQYSQAGLYVGNFGYTAAIFEGDGNNERAAVTINSIGTSSGTGVGTGLRIKAGGPSYPSVDINNNNNPNYPAINAVGTIQATGNIITSGNVIAYYSDDRLKIKLGIIQNPLEKLNTLSGFYYEPNELAQSLGYEKRREVGISAQDVQKILPEIIHKAPIDNKYLTVDYERLIPLIIEAIKELDRRTK